MEFSNWRFLERFFNPGQSNAELKMREEFNRNISIANVIGKLNPDILVDYVSKMGREYLDSNKGESLLELQPHHIWFHEQKIIGADWLKRCQIKREAFPARKIDLNRCLVIPTDRRYIATDMMVEYWLPFHIAWVRHDFVGDVKSIAAVTTVYDLSELLQHVECNGSAFVRCWDGEILAPVEDPKIAALFEVGRLMKFYRVGDREVPISSWFSAKQG